MKESLLQIRRLHHCRWILLWLRAPGCSWVLSQAASPPPRCVSGGEQGLGEGSPGGPTLRSLPARGGVPRRARRRRTAQRQPSVSRSRSGDRMGLEKERSDTSIIMDEDEFNRSIEPILSKKGMDYPEEPDRDPGDINAHLKVGFEDVIAEPRSSHSFDSVWIGSHAAFELVKFLFYRVLSTVLAVPLAFLLGVLFGVLSCIHIWLVMPLIQSFMMLLPSAKVVWRSVTDLFIMPLYYSMGKILSSVRVETTEN